MPALTRACRACRCSIDTANPVLDGRGKPKTIAASEWLEKNQSVEAFTWIPGEPEFIKDKLAVDGGWVRKLGATTLNTYRPPDVVPGDAGKAQRWVDHWRKLYRDDAEHLLAWMAARVQRPEVKPNHAIVLGGQPGIGKDTLLEPLVTAVGAWNFRDVTASQLFSKNNEFLRGVILRVSEARDMGEQGQTNRYGLYEHAKSALAIPPDTLRVNEKYLREYYIFNRFGMIITTNYRDALYLPDNDRRYFITFSDQAPEEFDPAFWKDFWAWYRNGGIEHVVAWLQQYDLSAFDPKATPRRTASFDYMVETERGEEYAELLNAIAALGNPKALTLAQLMEKAPALEWLHDTAQASVHSAPARRVRLYRRAQSRCRRSAVVRQQEAPGDLHAVRLALRAAPRCRQGAARRARRASSVIGSFH